MSILVIGGAGYIGSHVVQAVNQGHKAIIVDNLAKGHAAAVGSVGDRGTYLI